MWTRQSVRVQKCKCQIKDQYQYIWTIIGHHWTVENHCIGGAEPMGISSHKGRWPQWPAMDASIMHLLTILTSGIWNFRHKMVHKRAEISVLDQIYLLLAEFFLSVFEGLPHTWAIIERRHSFVFSAIVKTNNYLIVTCWPGTQTPRPPKPKSRHGSTTNNSSGTSCWQTDSESLTK